MAGRLKLAESIWQDAYGIAICLRVAGVFHSQRFPLGTPLRDLKDERDAWKVELRGSVRPTARRPTKHTLGQDVPEYLRAVRSMPTIHQRRQILDWWLERFGKDRPTLSLEPFEIQQQREALSTAKKSASTVNQYLRALSNLFAVMYPTAPNPVRLVPELEEPEPEPRAIPASIVAAIFAEMRDSAAKARLLVMHATGIPYATQERLKRTDVDLTAGTVALPRRKKGKGAASRLLPLTPEGVRAFKAFHRHDLWGKSYSRSSIYKSWKAAREKVAKTLKKPLDVRPYDLRHTFGTDVSLATGGNVATVAFMLASQQAERYRMAAIPQHLQDAASKLAQLRTSNGLATDRVKTVENGGLRRNKRKAKR